MSKIQKLTPNKIFLFFKNVRASTIYQDLGFCGN